MSTNKAGSLAELTDGLFRGRRCMAGGGLRLLVVATLFGACSGCGGSGAELPRVPVSGTVTVAGEVVSGVLAFIPLDGGPATGAEVTLGMYEIARDRGPVPGRYRVTMTAQTEKVFPPVDEEAMPLLPKPQEVVIDDSGKALDLTF